MVPFRLLYCLAMIHIFAVIASAQSAASNEILANQNRTPAGKLENGVLTVHLEIVNGMWHAEAEDGPPLYVQALEVNRVSENIQPTFFKDGK